ncbi:MAG TPA: hypothetical protein PLI30_03255 [Petrimonas sp.]|nr:hypothetical protein [Petrimonas sp.]
MNHKRLRMHNPKSYRFHWVPGRFAPPYRFVTKDTDASPESTTAYAVNRYTQGKENQPGVAIPAREPPGLVES